MIYFVNCNQDPRVILGSDYRLYPFLKAMDNTIFFNLVGRYAIGSSLKCLIPPYDIFNSGEMFRDRYTAFLNSNPDCFFDMMDVMINDYYGYDPIIITDLDNPVIADIVDCIIDYWYSRYGYSAAIIDSLEDYQFSKRSEILTSRLELFMQDKEFYTRESVDPKELLNSVDRLEEFNV